MQHTRKRRWPESADTTADSSVLLPLYYFCTQRDGDMSEEELKQCVLDMQTWLETNAGDVGKAFANAPPADGDKIKSLPAPAAGALQVGLIGRSYPKRILLCCG